MYKNILFDFDGTIANTFIGVKNGIKYSLNKFNITYSNVNFNEFIGPPLQDTFENAFGLKGKDNLKAIELFREYYRETGLSESELYKGITETLKTLFNKNYNLFIASTKPTEFIKKLLEKYDLLSIFKFISGSPSHGGGMSKDMIISTVIEKFNLDLSETIMVGDRKHDIIGAKQNNIHCIGVEYGMGTLEELQFYKPDYIAKSPEDILKIIGVAK